MPLSSYCHLLNVGTILVLSVRHLAEALGFLSTGCSYRHSYFSDRKIGRSYIQLPITQSTGGRARIQTQVLLAPSP